MLHLEKVTLHHVCPTTKVQESGESWEKKKKEKSQVAFIHLDFFIIHVLWVTVDIEL